MTSTVNRSLQSLKSTPHSETTQLNSVGELSDRKVLQALNAAVIITDVAGLVTYWNPFAERLYGWTAEEVVGQSIMGITVASETAEEAARHMAQLQAGKSWAGEFGVRCKGGKFLPALVTLSPLRDENGITVGIVGISQDLTGRKQVEEQLRAARAELERRVEERTEELRKANASLRDLSARLLQIRDHEARRLARELHDSVGQMLAAMGMNLATVQAQAGKLDQAGARAVADNDVLVKQISDEIRTISYLLHPPMLDEGGLASALQWYVDGFRTRSKIQVELEVPPNLGRLSADMETTIFRMVQECLTNIHRHSGSKSAVIRVSQQGAHIVVAAEDTGVGIPEEKLGLTLEGWSGLGFRGMAERIRHLGGKLEIRSTNAGTAVTAKLPLERGSGFETCGDVA
jgi:PAS domain S-box-containing protein